MAIYNGAYIVNMYEIICKQILSIYVGEKVISTQHSYWSLTRCPYYTGSTVSNFQFSQFGYTL